MHNIFYFLCVSRKLIHNEGIIGSISARLFAGATEIDVDAT